MTMLRTTAAGLILGSSVLAGGCQYERSTAIPPVASVAAEGNGLLTYRAGNNGTVYLFNRNANEVVFTGQIQRGQAIVVDSTKNQVLLDDKIVAENTLRRGDTYRIFFAPESATGGTVGTGSM
jgi:hypothetical protein